MDEEIERRFKTDNPIKSFEDMRLVSRKDLSLINDLLKSDEYRNVHFINWSDDTYKKLLDKNTDLKVEIYQKLVENMLRDNHLSIDLTDCQIDEQFLSCLADTIEKSNGHIGALLLSQNDENRFESSESKRRILTVISRNNENFTRFPSDYIHCLLACHCYTNRDETLEKKLNDLGWKVEEELLIPSEKEDKPNMYVSILYKNESKRQLVLAFRGIKLEVSDWFAGDSKFENLVYGTLANEVSSYSYYAYQHSKVAYEMSKSLNYNLSFTGYSFGAWLAEQSVYYCYKNHVNDEKRNVRAVTFDSPGSWEITQQLAGFNIRNRETDKNELGKFLDIKTFLFSPNFMNTSKEHIGRIYRVFEKSLIKDDFDSDSVEIWDDFIMSKFINKIPSNPLRKMFANWYEKIVKANLIAK